MTNRNFFFLLSFVAEISQISISQSKKKGKRSKQTPNLRRRFSGAVLLLLFVKTSVSCARTEKEESNRSSSYSSLGTFLFFKTSSL